LNSAHNHNKTDPYTLSRKETFLLLPFFIFYALITILVSHHSFFWDKDIIFSKIAYWLLENKFSLLLPDSLDTGYFPSLGYLLAMVWLITGKSLFVMHILMLPFSIGIVVQLYRFLRYYMPQKMIYPVMILVLADTTLMTQSIVFSTDLVMIFFLLLSLNSILFNKRMMLMVAVFGLLFSHMRGVMGMAMIGLFDLYKNRIWEKPIHKLPLLSAYLPALLIFTAYIVFHYIKKGWIGYHENSPWIGCFEIVDGKGFFRNIIIVAWRLIDYGKIFIIAMLIFLAFQFHKRKYSIDKTLADLVILLGLSVLTCVPSALVYKVLNSHRYFLPITIILTIITGYMLYQVIPSGKLRKSLYWIMLLGLLSGNCWTYPDTIAKGWDATLAHIPYYSLRNKMIAYIDSSNISFSDIGTEVPNNNPLKYYDLSDDERYIPIKDLKRNKYIFYSNIYNMFTDEEIMMLKRYWTVEKEFRCLLVRVTLYKNPAFS
jgi:hypothetical protein